MEVQIVDAGNALFAVPVEEVDAACRFEKFNDIVYLTIIDSHQCFRNASQYARKSANSFFAKMDMETAKELHRQLGQILETQSASVSLSGVSCNYICPDVDRVARIDKAVSTNLTRQNTV